MKLLPRTTVQKKRDVGSVGAERGEAVVSVSSGGRRRETVMVVLLLLGKETGERFRSEVTR
jgi:hypothetical protein